MKVTCEHCGLPFSVARAPSGPAYCCSGCALAARVPVDANGQFPVNSALVAALGLGFAFFNQVLFWLLALLLVRKAGDAQLINAGRFALGSVGVGALVWVALAMFQFQAGARRAADWMFSALGAGVLALALSQSRPAFAVAANALLLAWAMRGLVRKKVPAKK